MKKTLLSLAFLLTGVGAWAQETFVTPVVGGYYKIKGTHETYPSYLGPQNFGTSNCLSTVADLEDAAIFYVTDAGDNKYYFQCVNPTSPEIKYLMHNGDVCLGTNKEQKVTLESGENNRYYISVFGSNNMNNYIHNNQNGKIGTGQKTVTTYNQWGFIQVDEPAEIVALSYTLTDKFGKTYEGTYEGIAGTSVPSLAGITYSNSGWNGTNFTAEIEFPLPVSNADNTNAVFMANWGNAAASAKKWHAVLEEGVYNVKVQTAAPVLSEIDTWKWAIYPEFSDGAFTYTIKNIATGTYVYADPERDANPGSDKGRITLAETGTAFSIIMNGGWVNLAYVNNSSVTLKLTTNGSADSDVYLGSYTGGHNGNRINCPELASYQVNIPEGYATLYSPYTVSLPEGLTAYSVSDVTSTSAKLTAIEGGKVPAEYGVILEGTNESYTLTVLNGEELEKPTNLLEGTLQTTDVTGPAYVLAKVDEVVGFYNAQLTAGKFQNNAFKAYLPVNNNARFLNFDFGTETGIECIEGVEATQNAVVYDLAGRRVQNAQKGLYIVNGKKVVK